MSTVSSFPEVDDANLGIGLSLRSEIAKTWMLVPVGPVRCRRIWSSTRVQSKEWSTLCGLRYVSTIEYIYGVRPGQTYVASQLANCLCS
jgi:hypothetical protein